MSALRDWFDANGYDTDGVSFVTGGYGGQKVVYTPWGVWLMEGGVPTGSSMTIDEWHSIKDQMKADEFIAKAAEYGATATYDPATGKYFITDAKGNKYRTSNPYAGDVWKDIRAAGGAEPTPSNPWYGTPENPGPLTVTPEYPDGGPMPGGPTPGGDGGSGGNPVDPVDPMTPGNPQDPTGGAGWWQNIGGAVGGGGPSPINPGNSGNTEAPEGFWDFLTGVFQGGNGGMWGQVPGVPMNPIRTENPNEFSPYGTPVSRYSDQRTFGGLPRSTGPWGEMGGYYGGFPQEYLDNMIPDPGMPYPSVNPWEITGGQTPGQQWPYTPIGPSPYPGASQAPGLGDTGGADNSDDNTGTGDTGTGTGGDTGTGDTGTGGGTGGGGTGGGGSGGGKYGHQLQYYGNFSPQQYQYLQAAYLNGTMQQ